MTDQDIINIFVDEKRQKCIESRVNKQWINNNIEYKQYLETRYPEPFSKYSEVIARIYHHIDIIPICQNCGKPLPFRTFKTPYRTWCNQKCQLTDPTFIKQREEKIDRMQSAIKTKQIKKERYGNENYSNREKASQTMMERYGVKNYMLKDEFRKKSQQTMQEKYGVDNPSKSQIFLDKIKQTKLEKYGDEYYVNKEKASQTMMERYGVENYMLTDKFNETKHDSQTIEKRNNGIRMYYKNHLEEFRKKTKQTNLERYGVESYSNTPEYKERLYNTKKKNSTFNKSTIERQIIDILDKNNIIYKYQYKSDNYPFNCDFYFPDKDLYLEVQGTWTHGGHPFNPNSNEDIIKLEYWKNKNTKFYNKAIEVWTISDVKKREYAREHKLNWKEIFSINIVEITNYLKEWNIL